MGKRLFTAGHAIGLTLTVICVANCIAVGAPPPPPLLGGAAQGVHQSDFRITTFASDVPFPTSMQQLADGSLLVGSSVPITNYFNSTGQLLRFTDTNRDGFADAAPQVLASDLPGAVTSVRQAGDLVLVTTVGGPQPMISVLRKPTAPDVLYSSVGSIAFNFPAGWSHSTYALAVRPTTGVAGDFDVVFNVGSQANASSTPASNTVSTSGLLTAALNPDSLYKTTVHDSGSAVTFSNTTQLATGLRNAAGIAFAPNGDLWFADNGIDGPADIYGGAAMSADELNHISAADIGAGVKDFGFAGNYIRSSDGAVIGDAGVQPDAAFLPVADSQSEGSNEIAFAPASFPSALQPGVFVGFHGQFDKTGVHNPATGAGNDENPVVYYNQTTANYFHFIDNSEAFIGHPDGLLATGDSLFVSDIAGGSLFGNVPSGAIYQIAVAQIVVFPEPAAALLMLGLPVLLAGRGRRQRR